MVDKKEEVKDPVKEAQELLVKEQEKKAKLVADEIQAVLDKHEYAIRVLNNIQLVPKK